MRSAVVMLVIVACASAPPPVAPAAATCPTSKQAPDLDEAGITEKSHAYFDAADRHDANAVADLLAPGFNELREARISTPDILLARLRGEAANKAPPLTRTWKEQHVFRSGDIATFIGEAVVHIPARGEVPAHDSQAFFTLVWSRGTKWTVVHSEWDRHDQSAEKDRWNEALVYASFNRNPNQLLVDTVKGRKPGKALDIAMGQGRNALFLASQGWKTTGVDIANEGIKLAKQTAAKQKLEVELIEADVDTWDLGTNRWDLVTLIYAGAEPEMVERIKKSLKKGGLFVAEYFHVDTEAGKKSGASGFMTGELAATFKQGYKILRDEVVEDKPDWGPKPKMKLVRFVAQKL